MQPFVQAVLKRWVSTTFRAEAYTINGWIGVTENGGLLSLSRQSGSDEVDFWQAGGNTLFLALKPGEPFLFKLHALHPLIVVGG